MADVDVSEKIGRIDEKLDAIVSMLGDLREKYGRLDERQGSQKEIQAKLERRVDSLESRADGTDRKIWKWSGAIGIIAIIAAPLVAHFLPVQPSTRKAEQVVATEKRQEHYPPRREYPREGK